jgi:hypothetical protein
MRKTILRQQKSIASMMPANSLVAAQRLVAYVETASYVLLCRRILSTIAVCSFVWLASLWLSATLAQAQESPSNESGISVSQPSIPQPSIAATEPSHLVLSMVDRKELEPSSLEISATQPDKAGQHNTILLPSDMRGSEYASLAALASAPSSPLINAVQGEPGHTGSSPRAKAVIYQLGTINLVINGLPNSFSVSSAASGAAEAR